MPFPDAAIGTHTKSISNMATTDQRKEPTIRYLAVEGSVIGTCPRCKQQGTVGKFCFQCNDDEGMLIGTCPHCEECGPIGNMCLDCGDAKFEEEIPEGECPMCGDQGMRGTICSGCEDQSMLYE
jgi:hypothetical protein